MGSILLVLMLLCTTLSTFALPAAAATSGTTGSCTWTLDGTVLTISGNGSMENYYDSSPSPWGTSITEVKIEPGVISIGERAFSGCTGLTGVTIPDSVTSIGDKAFYGCTGLKEVEILGKLTAILLNTFSYCSSLKRIFLPKELSVIYENAFNGSPISHVYFGGTQTQHAAMTIQHTNGTLETAKWSYNETGLPEYTFPDVKAGAYYEKGVLWAVNKGVTNGTGDGNFSPDMKCSRGQIVTFLWRACGSPKAQNPVNTFKDVPNTYYTDAVLWAVENGITNGTSETTFSPDKTCSRGEIVTFLYRCMA